MSLQRTIGRAVSRVNDPHYDAAGKRRALRIVACLVRAAGGGQYHPTALERRVFHK